MKVEKIKKWFQKYLSPRLSDISQIWRRQIWPKSSSSQNASGTGAMPAMPATPRAGGSKRPSLVIRDVGGVGLVFRGSLVALDAKKVRYVVIHHTANANPRWGVKECHRAHLDRGWSGIGYHYFVEQDGTAYYGRSDAAQDWQGSHVRGYNTCSVGVCLDGDYSAGQQTPTAENLAVVAQIVNMLLLRYPKARVVYHSDLAKKECPGGNFPPKERFLEIG
jgi:hypothetical protein